ncbi:MAG: hypothetical protein M1834_007665 [Cirrosporium novae-zelandiae]|nr:MAG: hypothetical protein M1834_007665 [Cirrosporium novae-zelandiae]
MSAFRTTTSEAKVQAVAENPEFHAWINLVKNVSILDHKVSMRDGHEITVRSYTPGRPAADGSPLIVNYHGGGFCVGDLDTDDLMCKRFSHRLRAVVLNVDYRLAPEYPFPAGIHDAWDSLKWKAAVNATTLLKANPSKGFVVKGTSAGANFSAVLAHLARDEELSPPLTGGFLSIPATVHHAAVPEIYKADYQSYDQNKNVPFLNRELMDVFMSCYKPIPTDPLYSALLWTNGHANLVPQVFQICGADPLCDEGLIYERELRKAGVKTKLFFYPGLPHGAIDFFPQVPACRKGDREIFEGMKWLLEQE